MFLLLSVDVHHVMLMLFTEMTEKGDPSSTIDHGRTSMMNLEP
jgi:hypothetical protein